MGCHYQISIDTISDGGVSCEGCRVDTVLSVQLQADSVIRGQLESAWREQALRVEVWGSDLAE